MSNKPTYKNPTSRILFAIFSVNHLQAVPGSQPLEVGGRIPFMWAQSLYIVGRLLKESLVALGEIDPMNRRLGIQTKPEVIVQVRYPFLKLL